MFPSFSYSRLQCLFVIIFLDSRANFGEGGLTLHPPDLNDPRFNTELTTLDYDGLNLPAGTNLPEGYETTRSVDVSLPARDAFRERTTYPFQEFQALGVASAYMLMRLALPAFPGSTRSGPARIVEVRQILRGKALVRPADRALFPLLFDWRIWHQGVVPVLKDETVNPLLPLNAANIALGAFDEYAFLLERLLVQSFQKQGFLPV